MAGFNYLSKELLLFHLGHVGWLFPYLQSPLLDVYSSSPLKTVVPSVVQYLVEG